MLPYFAHTSEYIILHLLLSIYTHHKYVNDDFGNLLLKEIKSCNPQEDMKIPS